MQAHTKTLEDLRAARRAVAAAEITTMHRGRDLQIARTKNANLHQVDAQTFIQSFTY